MVSLVMIPLLCMAAHFFVASAFEPEELSSSSANAVDLKMPGITPEPETYICMSVLVNDDAYIVGFEALVEGHHAHHIGVYACEQPGSTRSVWDCGDDLGSRQAELLTDRAAQCVGEPATLFTWAMGSSSSFRLPKGVAFHVGGSSGYSHVVVQIHFHHGVSGIADYSGMRLVCSPAPVPRLAHTVLLNAEGAIRPREHAGFKTACSVDDDVSLHPFAFRVHTHRHGVEVSAWVGRENPTGANQWTLLGRRDPQLPQMFVPVNDSSVVIRQGDVLASSCLMSNNEDRVVVSGPTEEDEMCRFYLMFWTEGNKQGLREGTCSPLPHQASISASL